MRLTRLLVAAVFAAACAPSDKEDGKGQVDESEPPGVPSQLGKSDASQKVVPVDVQSTHPYANDTVRTYTVPLSGLPSCAQQARLHFNVLRTEANYDFVTLAPGDTLRPVTLPFWPQWDVTHAWFAKAGRYKLTFRYSSNSTDYLDWEGQFAQPPMRPDIVALLRRVPRFDLEKSIYVDVIE